jgi:hypothetical protein
MNRSLLRRPDRKSTLLLHSFDATGRRTFQNRPISKQKSELQKNHQKIHLLPNCKVFVTFHVVYVSEDDVQWDLRTLNAADCVLEFCETFVTIAAKLQRKSELELIG